MMRDERKIFTEFYIKNIVATLFEPNLDMAIKGEAPDFSNDNYLLEVVSLIEQDVAEPHALFEKYKGSGIGNIPNKVFEIANCNKTNIEILQNGLYGIRNKHGELKFLFNKNKKYVAYIHNPQFVSKMAKLFNDEIKRKRDKLNNVYEKRNNNYLGINFPSSFYNYKEEQSIVDFKNSGFYKKEVANSELLFFDKIFVVFADRAFEIDLINDKTKSVELDEMTKINILEKSKHETKDYFLQIAKK